SRLAADEEELDVETSVAQQSRRRYQQVRVLPRVVHPADETDAAASNLRLVRRELRGVDRHRQYPERRGAAELLDASSRVVAQRQERAGRQDPSLEAAQLRCVDGAVQQAPDQRELAHTILSIFLPRRRD